MTILFLDIAGFSIRLEFFISEYYFARKKLIQDIKHNLAGFIKPKSAKKPDYSVYFIEQQSIKAFHRKNNYVYFLNFYKKIAKNKIETYYHIGFIQFQIILMNILIELLTSVKGLMIHASSSLPNNKALLFLGQSGAGKSTIINLLNGKYTPLADDSVILKKEENEFFLYQTPFIEKEYWIKKSCKRYRLKSVYLLKKSSSYRIQKIYNKVENYKNILESLLTEKDNVNKQVITINEFIKKQSNFYYLYFGKNKHKLINLIEGK